MNIFFLNSQPKHTSVLGTKKNLLRLSSFQHPKHMFKLMDKKLITILLSKHMMLYK